MRDCLFFWSTIEYQYLNDELYYYNINNIEQFLLVFQGLITTLLTITDRWYQCVTHN